MSVLLTTVCFNYQCNLYSHLSVTVGNAPPIINNLNTELYVREDESLDKTVLTLAAFDENVYPSISYTLSAAPAAADGLFYIKGGYTATHQGWVHRKGEYTATHQGWVHSYTSRVGTQEG